MAPLDCGDCRLCCIRESIPIRPDLGDVVENYAVEYPPAGVEAAPLIAQKPGGDCHYLCAEGCSIYANRPALCRAFDCRDLAMRYNFTRYRKAARARQFSVRVFNRGRELLGLRPYATQ